MSLPRVITVVVLLVVPKAAAAEGKGAVTTTISTTITTTTSTITETTSTVASSTATKQVVGSNGSTVTAAQSDDGQDSEDHSQTWIIASAVTCAVLICACCLVVASCCRQVAGGPDDLPEPARIKKGKKEPVPDTGGRTHGMGIRNTDFTVLEHKEKDVGIKPTLAPSKDVAASDPVGGESICSKPTLPPCQPMAVSPHRAVQALASAPVSASAADRALRGAPKNHQSAKRHQLAASSARTVRAKSKQNLPPRAMTDSLKQVQKTPTKKHQAKTDCP